MPIQPHGTHNVSILWPVISTHVLFLIWTSYSTNIEIFQSGSLAAWTKDNGKREINISMKAQRSSRFHYTVFTSSDHRMSVWRKNRRMSRRSDDWRRHIYDFCLARNRWWRELHWSRRGRRERRSVRQREYCFLKYDMAGEYDAPSVKIKAPIAAVVRWVFDEDTRCGALRKFMNRCRQQVGVAHAARSA